MKKIFSSINLFFILLGYLDGSLCNAAYNSQSLVILQEYGQTESLSATLSEKADICRAHPQGIGAAAQQLIISLHQKVTVLIPAPLWSSIVQHRRLLHDFVTQTNTYLKKKYGHSQRFSTMQAIKKFAAAAKKACLQGTTQDYELAHYLMCDNLPLDDYHITRVAHPKYTHAAWYICIPKKQELALNIHHFTKLENAYNVIDLASVPHADYIHGFIPMLKKLFTQKENVRWSFYLMGHGICSQNDQQIAGLPLREFKKLIRFFDTAITTSLVYYSSCCSGGKHWIDAFTHADGSPYTLSYPIITDTLTETPSTSFVPTLDAQGRIETPYSFANFFTITQKCVLEAHDICDLLSCFNHLHTPEAGNFQIRADVNNLPSIRLPRATWFSIITPRPPLCIITNSACEYNVPANTEALLLYDKQIPSTIHIAPRDDNFFPSIVSMVPGDCEHTFSMIDAPTFTLNQIIEGFECLPLLQASKKILIKKLNCCVDESIVTLKNVTLELGLDAIKSSCAAAEVLPEAQELISYMAISDALLSPNV